jgi:hypothetical protein
MPFFREPLLSLSIASKKQKYDEKKPIEICQIYRKELNKIEFLNIHIVGLDIFKSIFLNSVIHICIVKQAQKYLTAGL